MVFYYVHFKMAGWTGVGTSNESRVHREEQAPHAPRTEAGLSVKDLQDIFGFATPQTIYKWQHGTALPSVDNLVLLSVIFGVTIDEILVVKLHQAVREIA